MALGQVRGAFSMSEPDLGSDVSAIKSRAEPDGAGGYTLHGQKMWLTNGARSGVVATLVRDDQGADSVYRNMTTFLIEKEPGFGEVRPGLSIPRKIDKMGYKGIETTEMLLDGVALTDADVLGGAEGRGQGFYKMMDGIEVGRVNVAARATGMAIRAFELGIAYAQQRSTFGRKLVEHQAIAFSLAAACNSKLKVRQKRLRSARPQARLRRLPKGVWMINWVPPDSSKKRSMINVSWDGNALRARRVRAR